MEVSVRAWSAWTPEWSHPACESALPDVSWVPANTRRRLSLFSKKAFFVTHAVCGNSGRETIFASRHGDLPKTFVQLQNLVASEPLSPTQFALSVHNAASGQYSIAANNSFASTTISAGEQTLSCALLAGIARLHASPAVEELVVVFTDDAVPERYREFVDTADRCCALALSLSLPRGTGMKLRLSPLKAGSEQRADVVDAVLSFLHKEQTALDYMSTGYCWNWERG